MHRILLNSFNIPCQESYIDATEFLPLIRMRSKDLHSFVLQICCTVTLQQHAKLRYSTDLQHFMKNQIRGRELAYQRKDQHGSIIGRWRNSHDPLCHHRDAAFMAKKLSSPICTRTQMEEYSQNKLGGSPFGWSQFKLDKRRNCSWFNHH